MSTALYTRLQGIGKAKLGELGQAGTLSEFTQATGPQPWDGGLTASQTWTVSGITTTYDAEEVDGERIVVGDVRLTMAATDTSGTAITLDQSRTYQWVAGGETYRVVSWDRVQPTSISIVYKLQLRRAEAVA